MLWSTSGRLQLEEARAALHEEVRAVVEAELPGHVTAKDSVSRRTREVAQNSERGGAELAGGGEANVADADVGREVAGQKRLAPRLGRRVRRRRSGLHFVRAGDVHGVEGAIVGGGAGAVDVRGDLVVGDGEHTVEPPDVLLGVVDGDEVVADLEEVGVRGAIAMER